MRLNAAAFNRHLAHMGQRMKWRRSYACACVNPDSGQADPKHALCNGKGRLWDAGIDTVAGATALDTQQQTYASGAFEVGDMVLSIPENSPMWDAGQYDRVLMMNSTTTFSQPLKRGAPVERLLFTAARFTRVFWLSPAPERAAVEGTLPVVDANGNLSWPNGGAPPMGTTYSLTGERYDEYFVAPSGSMPNDRNEHSGTRLPKRCVLRKWDLFGRSNS